MKLNFMSRLGALAFGVALVVACAVVPAAAQEEGVPQVVDEVIAQVNNEVITLSVLRREMKEAADALRQANPGMSVEQANSEVAKRQNEIIATLVNEQLLLQKGKELGLTEDVEAQVNQRMLEVARGEGIRTIDELERAMRDSGLDPAGVRASLRTEYMKNTVLGTEVDRRIFLGLTDSEVRAYYEAHKDRFRRPETVSLSEIFLSTVGKPEAEVLARARQLVTQLRGGGDFVAVAKAQSEREDRNGQRVAPQSGGKLSTYAVAEISNREIAAALQNVPAGGITDPIKTESGYIILRVDERTPGGEPTFEENKVREAMTVERMPAQREVYVRNLRQEAYVEIAPAYREAVMPLLRAEPPHSASAAPAPTTAAPAPPPAPTAPPRKGNKKKPAANNP